MHIILVSPGGAGYKEPSCQCRRYKRHEFDPWVGKILQRRAWPPTPVFLPGESHGQRSLGGHGPQRHKELDTTEASWHTYACHSAFLIEIITGLTFVRISFTIYVYIPKNSLILPLLPFYITEIIVSYSTICSFHLTLFVKYSDDRTLVIESFFNAMLVSHCMGASHFFNL